MCVCVCVREREKEKERENVCVIYSCEFKNKINDDNNKKTKQNKTKGVIIKQLYYEKKKIKYNKK